MNINKNENSLKNNLYDANKITSKKIKLFNLKFIHRIFDSVNISLVELVPPTLLAFDARFAKLIEDFVASV